MGSPPASDEQPARVAAPRRNHQPRHTRRYWLLTLLAFTLSRSVQAEDGQGSWTGSVAGRGNYYFERSTRVVAPSVNATLAAPNGTHLDATYLVDAITSASQATGVQSDVSFTEIRHDIALGVGKPVAFAGENELDFTLFGRLSKEPDYFSRGGGFLASLSLDERNTNLRFSGHFLHDAVSKIDRMAPAEDPGRLVAAKAIRVGSLDALALGVAGDRLLSPTTVLTLGLDFAHLDGFQANVYRMVAFADGGGGPEHHPADRNRYAPYLWLAQYLTKTHSALRLGYRYYEDSWSIRAHTPELRFHQEIGPYIELRARYRYYTQSSSFFYRDGRNLRSDRFITADPKMSAFHDHTLGFKLRLSLELLAFTALDALHRGVLEFGVEYILNTNRYGNGIIGQGGLAFPF